HHVGAIAAQLRQRHAHDRRHRLALRLALWVARERGQATIDTLGLGDALLDIDLGIKQPLGDTNLYRRAAMRRGADRRLAPEQPLGNPEVWRCGEEVHAARRQMIDVVIVETRHARARVWAWAVLPIAFRGTTGRSGLRRPARGPSCGRRGRPSMASARRLVAGPAPPRH